MRIFRYHMTIFVIDYFLYEPERCRAFVSYEQPEYFYDFPQNVKYVQKRSPDTHRAGELVPNGACHFGTLYPLCR